MSDDRDPTTGGEERSAPAVARPQVSEFEDRRSIPIPPEAGFTADDLDRIPDLPPHTELIDGSLVLVSPHKTFHMFMLKLLERQMDDQIPAGLLTYRECTVVLGERQRPEPDLMLVDAEALTSMDDTWVAPDAVRLVVEVVSPESEVRDHERKPQLYAGAGIPHFWLVEKEDAEGAVVYAYELDPVNGGYTMTGVHRERLKADAPCELDIDLTRLPRTGRSG